MLNGDTVGNFNLAVVNAYLYNADTLLPVQGFMIKNIQYAINNGIAYCICFYHLNPAGEARLNPYPLLP